MTIMSRTYSTTYTLPKTKRGFLGPTFSLFTIFDPSQGVLTHSNNKRLATFQKNPIFPPPLYAFGIGLPDNFFFLMMEPLLKNLDF